MTLTKVCGGCFGSGACPCDECTDRLFALWCVYCDGSGVVPERCACGKAATVWANNMPKCAACVSVADGH